MRDLQENTRITTVGYEKSVLTDLTCPPEIPSP